MAPKFKPKVFGPVWVIYDAENHIQYAMSDLANISPYPPTESPVDTLIASLGSCIIKSLQWSASQKNVPLYAFSVKLIGTKSTELPGRLESIDITIRGNLVEDKDLLPQIVKQAKSICTVSNTLNCLVTIAVEAG